MGDDGGTVTQQTEMGNSITMSTPTTPSLAAAVNAGLATKTPKGITSFNTRDLDNGYFRGMLYSETSGYKTTTAALFGGAKNTLFVLTRSAEQMLPLREQGFNVVRADDGEALAWAMQFPEKAADSAGMPEWKDNPDRVLVVDDMTEGSQFLVESNETDDAGKERKDGRQIYKAVNTSLRELLSSLKRKRMHLIFTALAKVAPSTIANEETIYPDMPAGARAILTADLEYVFFIRKSTKKMLTNMSYLQFTKKDERGNSVMGRREIFAKNKMPLELVGRTPPVIKAEEDLDLRGLWNRIRDAKATK